MYDKASTLTMQHALGKWPLARTQRRHPLLGAISTQQSCKVMHTLQWQDMQDWVPIPYKSIHFIHGWVHAQNKH